MKKARQISRQRRLKNNNHRRIMLKKLHHRVLLRRKQFDSIELNEAYSRLA